MKSRAAHGAAAASPASADTIRTLIDAATR